MTQMRTAHCYTHDKDLLIEYSEGLHQGTNGYTNGGGKNKS
jgi:hypothetical protein